MEEETAKDVVVPLVMNALVAVVVVTGLVIVHLAVEVAVVVEEVEEDLTAVAAEEAEAGLLADTTPVVTADPDLPRPERAETADPGPQPDPLLPHALPLPLRP